MGWLEVVPLVRRSSGELKAFADEFARTSTRSSCLGMGGSSLCPEVLRRSFGKQDGYPTLHILDSTVPAAVTDLERQLNLEKTLFIVASKSGGTTEPQMFYRYFRIAVNRTLGDAAGGNFIAITDPSTALEKQARDKGSGRSSSIRRTSAAATRRSRISEWCRRAWRGTTSTESSLELKRRWDSAATRRSARIPVPVSAR